MFNNETTKTLFKFFQLNYPKYIINCPGVSYGYGISPNNLKFTDNAFLKYSTNARLIPFVLLCKQNLSVTTYEGYFNK